MPDFKYLAKYIIDDNSDQNNNLAHRNAIIIR